MTNEIAVNCDDWHSESFCLDLKEAEENHQRGGDPNVRKIAAKILRAFDFLIRSLCEDLTNGD